jgi:hypothetical protein
MNIEALISLWNHTQRHVGTSGARVCAAVLLGLYNGARFPMDITDLRILDGKLLAAALDVIAADSRRCEMEVHCWLNRASGHADFSERFEVLAWEYETFKRGRAKKDTLSPGHVTFGPKGRMKVNRLVIDIGESFSRVYKDMVDERNLVKQGVIGKSASHVVVDELFGMKVIENASVPRDQISFMQHGKVVGTMKLVHDEQGKPLRMEGAIKLNAEQAAAVQAMCDNMPAEGELVEYNRDALPNLFQQRNRTE